MEQKPDSNGDQMPVFLLCHLAAEQSGMLGGRGRGSQHVELGLSDISANVLSL